MEKHRKNKTSGITLIALVVTIIVLLILAGISVMMLTGNNGILTRAGEAGKESVHANVYEQIQLKIANYIIENNLGNVEESSLIEYLQAEGREIIGEELGEKGSEKYQINVEKLLGTAQKYGNGTASGSDTSTYKDVYILQRETKTVGKIKNTKIAIPRPTYFNIPVEVINTSIYLVVYYGTANENNEKVIGNVEIPETDKSAEVVNYINEHMGEEDLINSMVIGETENSAYIKYTDGEIYLVTGYYDDTTEKSIITSATKINPRVDNTEVLEYFNAEENFNLEQWDDNWRNKSS